MLMLRWGAMPTEVRAAFAPLLHSYLWLVPGWCRQLYVGYEAAGEGDAESSSEQEYRQGRIYLHAGWLDCDPVQRRLEVIHEILHLPLAPMVDEHRGALERLFEDGEAPRFHATLQEQWRQRFEGTVQDLAFSVLAVPHDRLPHAMVIEVEDEHPPLREVA